MEKKCPCCQVIILDDGTVKFHHGKNGDLDFLAKRVCQYTKSNPNYCGDCINPKYDSTEDYENTYFPL
jgi:hypothetical protein